MRNYHPHPGERWQHYKGATYEIVGLAIDCSQSNRDIQGVVYENGEELFFRRIKNFMSTVTLPSGDVCYRFTRV
jgi:hypothetical protein